jgi:hypothetical protein
MIYSGFRKLLFMIWVAFILTRARRFFENITYGASGKRWWHGRGLVADPHLGEMQPMGHRAERR